MADAAKAETPEDIWKDDKLDRKADADLIQAFIESIAGRPRIREDSHGYVLAIDAPYGIGKTFFLKRLERQLSLNFPVAYVDAWSDDYTDDPLAAIFATLQQALKPYIKSKKAKKYSENFVKNSGKIVKSAGAGLLYKATTKIIGNDAVADILATTASNIISATEQQIMQAKIDAFNAGKKAISDIKRDLDGIACEIAKNTKIRPPIVIIIDELDRCRPSYAVQLLEIAKHLFDTQNAFFILGMYGDQFHKSLSVIYGDEFDGPSYLRRFIDRTFRLRDADIRPLIDVCCETLNITKEHFLGSNDVAIVPIRDRDNSIDYNVDFSHLIERIASSQKLAPREIIQLLENLQLCISMAQPAKLFLPLIVVMLIGLSRGHSGNNWSTMNTGLEARYTVVSESSWIDLGSMVTEFLNFTTISDDGYYHAIERDDNVSNHYYQFCIALEMFYDIRKYPQLLNDLGRFGSIENSSAEEKS